MLKKGEDTLHMKLPKTLKKKVKVAAVKADMTMAEWVIMRLKVGLGLKNQR